MKLAKANLMHWNSLTVSYCFCPNLESLNRNLASTVIKYTKQFDRLASMGHHFNYIVYPGTILMQYCDMKKYNLCEHSNFHLQHCFMFCDIIFALSPFSSSCCQQTAQRKQATPPCRPEDIVCSKPLIVRGTLNMHVN